MGQISISNFSHLLHRSRWGWKRVPLFPPRWKKCYVHAKTKIQRYIIRMIITEPISLWLGVDRCQNSCITASVARAGALLHALWWGQRNVGQWRAQWRAHRSQSAIFCAAPFFTMGKSFNPHACVFLGAARLMRPLYQLHKGHHEDVRFFSKRTPNLCSTKTSERIRRTQLWVLSDSSCYK